MSERTRVLIAEDHDMVGQGLRTMLAADYDVVDLVRDGQAVVAAVRKHQPDILLLDLSLPNRTGMDILTDLRSAAPETLVVVVTMHVDPPIVDFAMGLGAAGFVPKDAGVDELHVAIREALGGRRYVSPLLNRRIQRGGQVDRLGFGRLTPRQQDIVRMIGRGLRSEEIAAELGLTVHTIRFHRKNIASQLGFDNEWAMVRYAILVEMSEEHATDEA